MTEINNYPYTNFTRLVAGWLRFVFPERGGNQAAVNDRSTRRRLGLLDLPPEIRVMIFRHLLVNPQGLYFDLARQRPRPSIAILRTNSVIYREASEIFYGENQFRNAFQFTGVLSFPYGAITRHLWIMDTIRHIHLEINMGAKYSEIRKFLAFMHCFAHPSHARGTLTIEVFISQAEVRPLKWFIRALGRFTNFKTIELHFGWYSFLLRRKVLHVRQYLITALEPVLGHAEDCGNGWIKLRFHPTDHQQVRREPDNSDWADSLDGMRLEWHENTTDTENSETPARD